jgi:hypothetical protein
MQAYLKHIDRLNPIVHALRLGVEQAELIALAGTSPRYPIASRRISWLDAWIANSDWRE